MRWSSSSGMHFLHLSWKVFIIIHNQDKQVRLKTLQAKSVLRRVELCRTHVNPALQSTFQTFGTSCICRNEISHVPAGLHLLWGYGWALPLKALCPVSLPGKQAHGCPWNMSLNSFILAGWCSGAWLLFLPPGSCKVAVTWWKNLGSVTTTHLSLSPEICSRPGVTLAWRGMVPVLLHCPLFLVRKVKCFFPHCQRPSVSLFAVVHPAGSWCRCPSLHVM